jgi:aromatic ring-opening dioxygenase catalytic subunit (LigB family)
MGASVNSRMPVMYVPHGGGPWPFIEFGLDRSELLPLAEYFRSLPHLLPQKPAALLVISAHWEAKQPTVMSGANPPMLYDYSGFPDQAYGITWPAPGDPKLAARVRGLLDAAGFTSAQDEARGFDHGTFVPLKLSWPQAEIPTIQLSLLDSLAPEPHLRIGRALMPLRDEGVLIIGSGMSYHNLRGWRDPYADAEGRFDAWLRETATLDMQARDRRLCSWTEAPAARLAHPRAEHLLPMMVVAGAAGDDRGKVGYHGPFMRRGVSAVHFGSMGAATTIARAPGIPS